MRHLMLFAATLLPAMDDRAEQVRPCTLSAAPSKTSFKPGEPIKLTVTFKNTSGKPVTIYLANFWPNHVVVMKDGHDREPELTDTGRKMRLAFDEGRLKRDKNSPLVLKDWDSQVTGRDLNVGDLYRLAPGRYKVMVTYDDLFPPTPMRVTSKPVEFKIE
ncbi:MAG TPA: hypothetical protein VGH33_10565 [Isosphaeraceae bacterium]|jgi:hypothetical protein